MGAGPLFFAVMNPRSTEQTALERALALAAAAGGRVMAFLCVYKPLSEMGDASSAKEGKQQELEKWRDWLQRELRPFEDGAVAIEPQLYWNRKWYDSVVFAASRHGADLVLKNSSVDTGTRRRLFGTSDFALMRNAASPVMLVREGGDWSDGPIAACVDLESRDGDQEYLSNLVMKHANELARWLGRELCLLTVRRSADGLDFLKDERDDDSEGLQDIIAERYGLDRDKVQILERQGRVSTTLTGAIDELAPDMVVMGTLARKGIAGILLGNTAEKVLGLLQCDVITVG